MAHNLRDGEPTALGWFSGGGCRGPHPCFNISMKDTSTLAHSESHVSQCLLSLCHYYYTSDQKHRSSQAFTNLFQYFTRAVMSVHGPLSLFLLFLPHMKGMVCHCPLELCSPKYDVL